MDLWWLPRPETKSLIIFGLSRVTEFSHWVRADCRMPDFISTYDRVPVGWLRPLTSVCLKSKEWVAAKQPCWRMFRLVLSIMLTYDRDDHNPWTGNPGKTRFWSVDIWGQMNTAHLTKMGMILPWLGPSSRASIDESQLQLVVSQMLFSFFLGWSYWDSLPELLLINITTYSQMFKVYLVGYYPLWHQQHPPIFCTMIQPKCQKITWKVQAL